MTAARLSTANKSSRRDSTAARAFPLFEPGMPPPNSGLPRIIEYLDVERSARYQPTPSATYCNVYAADVCHLAGVYLPRVWWSDGAIVDMKAGRYVAPTYGESVNEQNANALFDWLGKWGAEFGWEPVGNAGDGQRLADAGALVVISAAKTDWRKSDHISFIVPQSEAARSRDGIPVQSQAGRKNYRASTGPGRWWEDKTYRGYGLWKAVKPQ